MIFHSYQPGKISIILTYFNLTGEGLHKHVASVPILFTLYYFKYYMYIYCTDNYEINMFKKPNLRSCKNDNFQIKNCDIFLIFAQNIDCGYTLEPPKLA